MRTVCAWCSTVIRAGTGPVSHGICETCKKNFMKEIDDELHTTSVV